MDSARLLPMKNTHLKILQNVQVKNDDWILVSSDRSAAWYSINKLNNPIRVLVENNDGPI